MSISTQVHAAVEASRADANLRVGEDPGRLHVSGTLTRAALDAWQIVTDLAPAWLSMGCIDAADDPVQPKDVRDGEPARITVTFAPFANARHLFTPEGWRSLLLNDALVAATSSVRLAFDDRSFKTKAFDVGFWEGAPVATTEPTQFGDGGPRRSVRCQSSDLMAPSKIEPWIHVGEGTDGPAWQIWAAIAAAMIARSLPSELYKEDGADRVGLAGQPPRRLDLGTFPPDDIPFGALQQAAAWVYVEGTDIEVRHTFLSSELAREWPPGRSFAGGLKGKLESSLDSARLLYKSHLRAGSKDTLKALADLRKTLADDVQKLVQQARDLSSAVWRDVAVAIGVMAVRFGLDAAKTVPSSFAFSAIYLMVALYFVASFWLTTSINRRYLTSLDDSRSAWRTKLYAFLDDDDYRSLAGTPLSEAVSDYMLVERRTRRVVIVVVMILVLATLIEAGAIDLHASVNWIARHIFLLYERAKTGMGWQP